MVRKTTSKARREMQSARVREPSPGIGYAPRRLLLDTHAWLWWQSADQRLGTHARGLISMAGDVRLSIVSVWEIAIKANLGKLDLPDSVALEKELARNSFSLLTLELSHFDALRRLPLAHRDPFDRMLVAQAQVEGLTVLTADKHIPRYEVSTISAAH